MDIEKRRDAHTDRETLRIFARVLLSEKKPFLLSLLLLVSKVITGTVLPLVISMTIAAMVTGSSVQSFIIWLVVIAWIGALTNWIGITTYVKMSAKGQYELTVKTFETLLSRSVGFHANSISGKLVSNAQDYPSAYGRLLDALYVNLSPLVLVLIVGVFVVALTSPILALALFIVVGIIVGYGIYESRTRSAYRFKRRAVHNKMIAHYSDTIVNASAVKTFARESSESASHEKLSTNLMQHRVDNWIRTVTSGSIRIALLLTMQVGLIALIAHLYATDPSVLGAGIFTFVYTITLMNRLFDITNLIMAIEESFLDASSMTRILMQNVEITDKHHAPRLIVSQGGITLNNVSFSYPDNTSKDSVFDKLSLEITPGQKVGIVGPSGGGKSTLTRLLLRFDDVTDGAITIDDQDVRDVTQQSLRSQIAYVPQEPLLFHRSILENIAYGKPDATLEEVKKAAHLAYADDFIEQLPQGYDTIVGERGVKLSGGQRQRIAIARAILKDAPILIFDEATSALDSESEVYIQKALAELMKGRTTIVIAHRLSTIQKMDRIIVLDGGKIKEDGTHKNLLKANKLYAKLWSHQSGGFIED